MYLRARWYDPSSGTFTARDPFGGFDTEPTSLHPYTYAGNNPLLYTDATGNCFGVALGLDTVMCAAVGVLIVMVVSGGVVANTPEGRQAAADISTYWALRIQTTMTRVQQDAPRGWQRLTQGHTHNQTPPPAPVTLLGQPPHTEQGVIIYGFPLADACISPEALTGGGGIDLLPNLVDPVLRGPDLGLEWWGPIVLSAGDRTTPGGRRIDSGHVDTIFGERGFTEEELDDIIDNYDRFLIQKDGAGIHLKSSNPTDTLFNVVITGTGDDYFIVTAFRGLTINDLNKKIKSRRWSE